MSSSYFSVFGSHCVLGYLLLNTIELCIPAGFAISSVQCLHSTKYSYLYPLYLLHLYLRFSFFCFFLTFYLVLFFLIVMSYTNNFIKKIAEAWHCPWKKKLKKIKKHFQKKLEFFSL